jgi:hypothetical protein
MKTETAHTRSNVGVLLIKQNSKTFIKFDKVKDKPKPIVEDELDFLQNKMYYRLVQGLKHYSPEQIEGMDEKSIALIKNQHILAKSIIVRMKKQIYFKAVDNLFFSIFPEYRNDPEFYKGSIPSKTTLSKLGITKKKVCLEFIKAKLLPQNFFNISHENLQL